MTKRALEESPSGCNSKDRRISYLFINNLSVIQKATTALERGCGSIKLCIESTSGPSLWVKPGAINTTFGALTHKDYVFFVNKNKKLILVTNHHSSIEKVVEYINSTTNAIIRLTESNIVTKYIIRDVETDFLLEDIAKEIAGHFSLENCRVILWVSRFIENPKVCFKCLEFGHTQIRCNKEKRGRKCGGTHNDECNGPIKCFRCNEPHDALDKKCTIFLRVQEIVNLVRNHDISFAEARKRVETGQSFAAVAGSTSTSKSVVSSGVQAQLSDLLLVHSNSRTFGSPDSAKIKNKNLQALIDSQNKTIESLTNRLTVLESNYGFRSSESPDPGLFHQSLDELNNFTPAIPVDTGPGIGGKFDAHWLDSVISHHSPPFLILGDFNVYHPALGSRFSSSDAFKVLDWISANNMCLINISQFTRFQTGHAPSLLDLSICSADIYNNISFEISHDTYDSDHCPILMSLKNLRVRTTKTRQYINWNRFSKNINHNLSNSGQNLSIEMLSLQFQSNAAASSYSISAQNHSPWWDTRCSFLKALKRKALRKAKSYPSIANWSHYKKIAARLRKYIKHCTRSYWERNCAEVDKSHQAFRIIKAMMNKDVSPCQSHLILSSGMVLSSPTAQANAIATNLIKNAPAERIPLDFSENCPESPAVQSLNQPFSMKEFKDALSKTSNRSSGPDKITKKIITSLSDANLYKVLGLFNDLWYSSSVPVDWRLAKIVPILKPGKKPDDMSSYRPIALTSVLCKLFERMILARLLKFYMRNKFFPLSKQVFSHTVCRRCCLTRSLQPELAKIWFTVFLLTSRQLTITYGMMVYYSNCYNLESRVCRNNGIITYMYPLHEPAELEILKKKWTFTSLPLGDVRNYFGEAVAFYFAFTFYYTCYLLPTAVIGAIQSVISFDISRCYIFFAIFKMIWVTLFLENWKRKSNELAYTWGTLRLINLPKLHPTFRGIHMDIDPVTKQHVPIYPAYKRHFKVYCISLPLVILCLIFAIVVMLVYFQIEEWTIQEFDDGSFESWIITQLPGIIYAILVYVMNVIYAYVANILTEWENHRTQESFDNHRIIKLLLFEFVNNFIAMGYIAFYQQDLNMLKWQIAVMMVVNQLFNQFQEAILPFLLQKYRQKWRAESSSAFSPRMKSILEQRDMWSYEGTYDDYLEVFTQFGYVFLFSSVFPLAALLAVLNNVLEVWMDGFKLCYSYQRPQARAVKGIGVWQVAFEVLSLIAVMSNCALISMSPMVRSYSPDMSIQSWLLVAVAVEHVIIAVKMILAYSISDVPKWVLVAIQKAQFESLQALKIERKEKTKYMLQSMNIKNLAKVD
ncbi:Anoctamin-10 [Araneus ventricosus]|uniref:Anoctamin n=1 Tax=Araneus ventricosus TaxID=182803 RepID=A0A4Y2EDV6_ARAVE|nr:Anoctamin-10 [Araneus ventricosus]